MKLVKQLNLYLQENLQTNLIISKLSSKHTDKLPMVISGAFDLFTTQLYGKSLLFAIDHTGVYSPVQLKKVANIILERLNLNCVFVFDKITGYNQSRMIKHGVNFIVVGKMMFMPKLFIDLRPMRVGFNQDTKMPATSQLILLYHLECSPILNMSMTEIAERMNVSYATCNKALTWLRGHSLAKETKVGKNKFISLDTDKWALWNKAQSYLYSPVERVLYTDKELLMRSGYNALSFYSHLSSTDEQVFAWADSIPSFFFREENDVKVEIWRYSPHILSSVGVVDPLSLYLILKDDDDERVSIELDYMLHKVLD